MKKIIYFYGPAEVKKHGGLEGVKNYARKNRYQLRDASLHSIEGQIEKADEYKGDVPDHYKEYVEATAAEGDNETTPAGSDQTPNDPTA